MKLTKSVIKEIVKECLIEVLAEGINGGSVTGKKELKENINAFKPAQKSPASQKRRRNTKAEQPILETNSKIRKNENLEKIAMSVTDDPILTEMLADTAHTTLQEQIAAESSNSYISPSAGDKAQKKASLSTPEDLFGEEASSKWAQLAFGG